MSQSVTFGFPEHWKDFETRNEKFMVRFPNLKDALNVAFLRVFDTSGPEDRTVFTMGRLCSEEFFEIILLAGNGYGFGALKLLRSLYERAVTMDFLSQNPSEIDAFMNYHAVAQYKLFKAIHGTFGPNILSKATEEETEREYKRIKDDYLITSCEKCKTKRVNHTWHKLDIVAMSKKTRFGQRVVDGYIVPMGHSHSTVRAIISRVEESETGGMEFNAGAQPAQADNALKVSHNLMLGVLEVQRDYFKLKELEQPLQTCYEDYVDMWRKDSATSKSS